MKRNVKVVFAAVGASVVLYVSVFSYWWLSSPSYSVLRRGKSVRVVEFQYNSIFWHTGVVWYPALVFVEHVMGYRPISLVACGADSVARYEK